MTKDLSSLIALGLFLLYAVAFVCVYRVLLTYRTAPGAIAWIMGLLGAPYVTVPLFLFFGRNRFSGYVRARRMGDQSLQPLFDRFESQNSAIPLPSYDASDQGPFSDDLLVLSRLARQPFTTGNQCTVLRDGEATFQALFEAMESAARYILLEFYIVRSDRVGQRIKSILQRKLAEGVEVWFLYDDIGSFSLSRNYFSELVKAGARVASFGNGNVRRRRFQINFRNHRKLLICDGNIGFVGGINLGDEYLGTAMGQEPWRDTHCRIQGPAVLGLQLAWLEDWNWASDELPELDWPMAAPPAGEQDVLILPANPADSHETGTLFFLNCINNARERIWIASPYFVPDLQILNALELACLRGVDVRILIPEKSDNQMIRLAAYSYLVQASRAGIGIYQYQQGFMHQKVVLVDNRYAAIGTANLDNRSMRLNFEITALSTAAAFVTDIENMLLEDLKACRLMTARDYRDRSLAFRIGCRAVRLLAPLL
ncbi:cardiolipin synthase [Marinobacter mobilis]|uniref:cardiolipin synthase n=1 Tax=Marinobacter mobilis TaxID=488533 RepID=UPI0035C72C52